MAEPQTPAHRSKKSCVDLPSTTIPSSSSSQPSPVPSSHSGSRGSRTGSLELRPPSLPTSLQPSRKLSEMGVSASSLHRVNTLFASNNNDSVVPLSSSVKMLASKNLLTSEPDLLSGMTGIRQDAAADSLPLQNINDTPEETLEDEELLIDDFGDEFYNEDFSDVQMLPYDLESERSESSLHIKKKGFLQKLSLSKWTHKKTGKTKAGGKVKEIAPEYFKETYVSPRNDREDKVEDVQEETVMDSEVSGVTTIAVGQDEVEERLDTRLSKSLSPSSRKSLYSSFTKTSTSEGLSVATSDDSGILASRPMSSASKSETSLSRPDSSTSDPPVRKTFSASQDELELALPSLSSEPLSSSSPDDPRQASVSECSRRLPATIITLRPGSQNINGLPEPNNNLRLPKTSVNEGTVRKSSTGRSRGGRSVHIEEKPWYDVSDDDVDLRTPDHITSIISVRGSSDEDQY